MPNNSKQTYRGIVIASLILIAWSIIICYGLFIHNGYQSNLIISIGLIILTAHLYTGLFITAHDAMHGTVAPNWIGLNNLIGTACVTLYACFSYRKLLSKHKLHHSAPASSTDPDFAPTQSALKWYRTFMLNYLSWQQLLLMAIIHLALTKLCGVSNLQTILYWALPMWISTCQLFYFGTFLPHQPRQQAYPDQHHAWSLGQNWLLSLLSCYHFGGCHLEHHRFPGVPWWALYQIKQSAKITD